MTHTGEGRGQKMTPVSDKSDGDRTLTGSKSLLVPVNWKFSHGSQEKRCKKLGTKLSWLGLQSHAQHGAWDCLICSTVQVILF